MSLLFRDITSPKMFRVKVQNKHLYKDDKLLTVSKIIPHPNFYTPQKGADIALLKLTKPVKISRKVRPVSLPPASMKFPSGMWCWVTGWGDIREDGMW